MIQKHAFRMAAWTLGLAGLLSSAATTARAEFFEYTTAFAISNVGGSFTPTGSTIVNDGTGSTFSTPGGNVIKLIDQNSDPAIPHNNGTGAGTDIVFGQIDPTSGITNPTETVGFNYTATLTFTDYAAANSTTALGTGTVTLNGRIEGTVGDLTSNLNNLVFAPNPQTFTTSNGTAYNIDFNSYTPPGLDNNGTFGAHVTAAVPEPSSVAMLGLGGLGALGLLRRSRKAKANVNA